MLPIAAISRETAENLSGVLFDLDDTFLDGGLLSENAYGSLFRLREAGLILVAVTGRPSGWGEVLALQWPVHGFVTENGAVSIVNQGGALQITEEVDTEARIERKNRLLSLAESMMSAFPDLRPSKDVAMRRSDFTFDVGEFRQVQSRIVTDAMNFAQAQGAISIRSSVHLHISFDGSDKASGTLRLLRQKFGFDMTDARRQFAFIGDSENDEAGFAAFQTSVAVANLRGRPTISPQYVTRAERSLGFVEFAEHITRLRRPTLAQGP
jgi:HAD superfamily hydrolase (TIGR01484 family)